MTRRQHFAAVFVTAARVEVRIEKVTDMVKIASAGVMSTPAVIEC